MPSILERRYRLLLNAYPPEYLDRNEEEIIGTLLEAAKPGQLRPTLAEASSLVIAGIRVRVRSSAQDRVGLMYDSVRLAALLLVASILGDLVSAGSNEPWPVATIMVAGIIAAVVIGASRLASLLGLMALVIVLLAGGLGWYNGDIAGLLITSCALAAASIRSGGRRPRRWWLAIIAIALPFLYRLFWSGTLAEHIPLSLVEVGFPVAIFSAIGLVFHDPRPAIAAATYAAVHLVTPFANGFAVPGAHGLEVPLAHGLVVGNVVEAWIWSGGVGSIALTSIALSIALLSYRQLINDLANPSTSE